eukprot:7216600-Karenia_brevis.AAC.1
MQPKPFALRGLIGPKIEPLPWEDCIRRGQAQLGPPDSRKHINEQQKEYIQAVGNTTESYRIGYGNVAHFKTVRMHTPSVKEMYTDP